MDAHCPEDMLARKSALRRELRARRDALTDREARSAAICARLAALPELQSARAVHCYLPIRSEVDSRPLLKELLLIGKPVIVPIVRAGSKELAHAWLDDLAAEELETAGFGTLQPRNSRPARLGDWDLTIVPMLGFDRRGYRIGYGQGFYDRLLAAMTATSVGLAFAAQEVAALPVEDHDAALDFIVTEDELIG